MLKEEVFCSVFFGIAVKYGEIGAREVTEKVVFGPVLRSALHDILCKYYMLFTWGGYYSMSCIGIENYFIVLSKETNMNF